jgi:hypothetical protein
MERTTLFLGNINTGTWPSRLRDLKNWDNKIWTWAPWDSDPSGTALARTSSNIKLQTCPLVREGAKKITNPQLPKENLKEKEVVGTRWVADTRTDWLTDCHS